MLDVTSEDIASVVGAIFEATFSLAIEQVEPITDPSTLVSSSLVGIAGRWDGAVIVDCSPGVATSLAAIMFGLEASEVGRDEVEDALGELANMIGGNVKALIAPPCTLSLPTVVEGRDYRVRVPGATIVRDLHFAIEGGHVRVLVAERGSGEGVGSELEAARAAAALAHREAQRVLDTVDQGLFTIGTDGEVGHVISAAAVRWFGAPPVGVPAWEWLRTVDPTAASWLEVGWAAHREGSMPLELTLAQLPERLRCGDRSYAVRWLASELGGELLAVVTDVTELLQAERVERAQRELVAVLGRLIRDRQGFLNFIDEADAIVHVLQESSAESDRPADARRVHTIKGNAGMFGLVTFAERCHAIESRTAEHQGVLQASDRIALVDEWHDLRARIEPFLGRELDGVVQVPRPRLASLLAAVIEGEPHAAIEHELRRWTLEPTRTRLERFAEQARELASRLGKGAVTVAVDDRGLALPSATWAPMWSAFAHVIRNAVDHGLESPPERAAAGKADGGQIWLSTEIVDGEFVITIRDDGRGIDWDAVAARAREAAIPCSTPAELQRALFAEGISTAARVTDIAGRGIGLAAIEAAAVGMRGRVVIRSVRAEGTTLEVRFPEQVATAGATLEAA